MKTVNWGIIGTGAIASTFARSLEQTERGRLVAVASRSSESAERFGREHDAQRRYGKYDELLADSEVDAVYVSTPHPFHAEWAIKAIEAGKHVLCEKPLALNHGEAMAIVEAARENERFLMEAFMYRCHPQTTRLVELLRAGTIGDVRVIRVSFGFGGGEGIPEESRLFDRSLGGGSILDIGCYPMSLARLVAGAAAGVPFSDPTEIRGAGRIGRTGVDEWEGATLRFAGDIVAQISAAVRVTLDNTLEIFGSEGRISVPNPWLADRREPTPGRIIVTIGQEAETIEIPADRTAFAYEADRVAEAIEQGSVEGAAPAMTWDDSLGNLAALDRWRSEIGMAYEAELESGNHPVRGSLRRRANAPMSYGRIPGLEKRVSKLVMGCDNQQTLAHGAAMWDDWFERGGNAFDTSWVYGRGTMEILLGKWIKSRNIREEVVVDLKGAHTPRCYPDLLRQDFLESLDRLQFDYADLYIMHRDNLEVPVGEFVDVLNELKDEGLIRGVFGGSNWTVARFVEANDYARANGKQGFTVMNNNLSLARMVKPVWAGCLHVSDRAARRWLEETGTTNLSWSSQARGYFLPEAERMKLGEANFECWDAPDNRARRERAEELARKKGCTPINIAAAYVINQPFPSFALVGPRAIHETATTLPALAVELSREEIDWLWGEEPEPVTGSALSDSVSGGSSVQGER